MSGGRIPQQFIDDLLARVDIVDVIDARLPLRKAGREYSACCPFHNEKTPSFTVSRDKQFYHCFGCGAHGSAIGFLMEFDHLNFVEAVEELARDQNLEVPREGGDSRGRRDAGLDPLYELLAQAAAWYGRQLRQHAGAGEAVDYLKARGLSGETAAAFGLGYAPPGWDNLLKALGKDDASRRHLKTLGLVTDKGHGEGYDKFRHRIMFPIRDLRGRVIGFGGRAIGDDKPKYMNSPESAVFHKGQELYGLYEARQRSRRLDSLLVVEGYMDAIALAQAGINNVVATLGTATTTDHLVKLFRYVKELVFCFDGDRAGRQAAWRALENALPQMQAGREIRFMFLPDGEDPDSIVKKEGADRFRDRLETSIPFSEFLFEIMLKKADISSIDGRAKLVELVKPLLSKVPDGVYKHMLTARLSELAQLDTEKLGMAKAVTPAPAPVRSRLVPGKSKPSLVRRAIQLLLARPALAQLDVPLEELKDLKNPGFGLLLKVIEAFRDSPHINAGVLIERWRDQEDGGYLVRLLAQELPPEEVWEAEFIAAMSRLDEQARRNRQAAALEGKALHELNRDDLP